MSCSWSPSGLAVTAVPSDECCTETFSDNQCGQIGPDYTLDEWKFWWDIPSQSKNYLIDNTTNDFIQNYDYKGYVSCLNNITNNSRYLVALYTKNYNTNVLDIQLHKPNSWQIMFGTSKMTKNYQQIMATCSEKTCLPRNKFRGPESDYNIVIDDVLEKHIINFLNE